jgi:hypothetical protein
MLLSFFLLLVLIAGISCGTVAGKHLDGVEGVEEEAAALVFLCFFGVEGVDAAPALCFFPLFTAAPPLLPLSLVSSSLTLFPWLSWTKAKGSGAATSFEAQTDFDVLQV